MKKKFMTLVVTIICTLAMSCIVFAGLAKGDKAWIIKQGSSVYVADGNLYDSVNIVGYTDYDKSGTHYGVANIYKVDTAGSFFLNEYRGKKGSQTCTFGKLVSLTKPNIASIRNVSDTSASNYYYYTISAQGKTAKFWIDSFYMKLQ